MAPLNFHITYEATEWSDHRCVRPGTAMTKLRRMKRTGGRVAPPVSSLRDRHHATATSASAATAAGSRPPVNSAAIETFVTEPMVISTRLGGMVSDIAEEDANKQASS